MKTFLFALLALLVGLVLGGWGPKADLRKAHDEIEQLQKQARQRGSRSNLDGITAMLRLPEGGAVTTPGKPAVTAAVAAVSNRPTAEPLRRHPRHWQEDEAAPPPDRQTLQERLQTASDLWKVRADLARSGFVANVTTSAVQASQFDLAVADMNLRLGNAIREWVDSIKDQKNLTPETGIRMMNTLSSELVETYNQFDETMPADWRQRAGDKFQVFDLIDPQVALPLTEIEGKMQFQHGPPEPANP